MEPIDTRQRRDAFEVAEGDVALVFNPWADQVAAPARVIDVREEALEAAVPQAVVSPRPALHPLYRAVGKRAFDLALVLLTAPVWMPLYGLIALALLIVDGRPIHFRAIRPGAEGRDFSITKFRTMHANAEEMLPRLLADNPELREEFRARAKLRGDPRVTRLGRVLRRLSLDEVPQLWNVLKGDMSLVGPRPPASRAEMEAFFGDLSRYAFTLRPGLTGMWQVERETDPPYERRVWLDLIYASRCSLGLDLKILFRTVRTVLGGHGAF